MKSPIALSPLIALALIGGCVNRDAQKTSVRVQKFASDVVVPVEVAKTAIRDMAETFEVTGQIVSSEEATIAAETSGRVVALLVKNGDFVKAGQLLARQDTQQASIRQRQALAGLRSAQAQLNQALTDASVSPNRSDATVRAAQAQLAQARASLKRTRAGDRSEQRRQVQAQVDAARTQMENAKKTLERFRALFKEGAVSRQEVEQYETAYAQALSGYEQVLETQRIQQTGARPEDIAIAEQQVRAAEEALRQAQAAKQLDPQLQMRVDGARAGVENALEAVRLAQVEVGSAAIRAPFSGQISSTPTPTGTYLGPGAVFVRMVGAGGTYFEGDVPELKLGNVQIGRSVTVRLDSLQNRTFIGTVRSINPAGNSVGRMFKVRIGLLAITPEVRPGMFARGQIEVSVVSGAQVLPKIVVMRDAKGDFVMIKDGDKAKRVVVTKGLENKDVVAVTGVDRDADVIVVGQQDLADGAKVRLAEEKK